MSSFEKTFPHLALLSAGEWIIILAILAFGLIFIRSSIRKSVASSFTGSAGLIARLVNTAVTEQRESFAQKLLLRFKRLEELKRREGWHLIGVRLHGLRRPEASPTEEFFAPVLLNVDTGELRPAPEKCRYFTPSEAWFAAYARHAGETPPRIFHALTGPRWQPVEGETTRIVFLGEIYTYK